MSDPIELVIFDCDGVLVDSERISVRVDVAVLAQLGWPMTEAEVVERFMGRTDADMAAEVPGILEALDAIAGPICVASSGTHERMRYTLGLTGLYPRFAGRIFSASEVARGKPAPDLFLHAAGRMGVRPAACAVVEDSRYGVEAARVAGMRAFGYAGGLSPRAWLEGPGTVVFDEMRDLPRLLGNGPDI